MALAAVEAFLGAGAGPAARRRAWSARASPSVDSPGRLERVRSAPTILLDGAHNPHGMAATVAALQEEFAFRRLVAVVAVLADKDAAGLLDLLEPVADAVVVTRNTLAARDAGRRAGRSSRWRSSARTGSTVAPTMPDAIEAAVALAEADMEGELSGVGVLITGSVVTVADARRLLKR